MSRQKKCIGRSGTIFAVAPDLFVFGFSPPEGLFALSVTNLILTVHTDGFDCHNFFGCRASCTCEDCQCNVYLTA